MQKETIVQVKNSALFLGDLLQISVGK